MKLELDKAREDTWNAYVKPDNADWSFAADEPLAIALADLQAKTLEIAAKPDEIEKILFRRCMERKLEGYTLEASLEIAEIFRAAAAALRGGAVTS